MKRREFLTATAGLAGAALPTFALGQTRPCPPAEVSVTGGSLIRSSCGTDAESDWAERTGGPGVVWYHDFRSATEVDNFRWQGGIGNDPDNRGDGSCRWISTDGITGGGCLEINIPTNGTANAGWQRPFSPLLGGARTGNGRGVADPGAGLTPLAWNPSNASQAEEWTNGFYAHPDDVATLRGSVPATAYDGSEFYIQFRVKLTTNRGVSSNPPGKLIFLGRTRYTPNNEIVLTSNSNRILRAYTNFGSKWNSTLSDPQVGYGDTGGTVKQPGGAYDATCIDNVSSSTCWAYPLNEWVTVLVHIRAGHHASSANLNNTAWRDTQFEILVARAGATQYTSVYSKNDFVIDYGESGDPKPWGWNAFIASGYMNGVAAIGGGWQQRFDQIIFSKDYIPCPRV
jgi:hypothetical protein